jgi:hypothetical protein
MGKEILLAFNEYKRVPQVVNELDRYGFVVLGEVAWDIVPCIWAYCNPLGDAFDVSR